MLQRACESTAVCLLAAARVVLGLAHLGEKIFLKTQANGKAGQDLEGDVLAFLHEALQQSRYRVQCQ